MNLPSTRSRPSRSGTFLSWALFGFIILGIIAGIPATARPVAAAPAATGSVSLSPVKVTDTVAAGPHVIPLTITNQQQSAVQVEFSTTGLTQNADGTALFRGPAQVPTTIGVPRFTLDPGQRRTVPVTLMVSDDTAGVYEAVLATVSPTNAPSSGVSRQARIASVFELPGPASGRPAASISDITATGNKHTGQITFSALVHDTGDVLISPTGTATITQGGSTLATVPLTSSRIVPGAGVTYSGAWNSSRRLDGAVDVHIHLENPTADATKEVTFTSGAAPTAAARISTLKADPTRSGATIHLGIANTGNVRFPAASTITTFDGHTTRTLATNTCTLSPKKSCARSRTLSLSPGDHVLSVTVRNGSTVLDQRQITFAVPTGPSVLTIVLIVAGILVIAAIVIVIVVRRRRRRGVGVTGRRAHRAH